MLGSTDEIQLFQNLVRLIGAKKTLDIGKLLCVMDFCNINVLGFCYSQILPC